ncbi:MAG: hypothetical protein WD757_03090 [Actinomycetota bacterium]
MVPDQPDIGPLFRDPLKFEVVRLFDGHLESHGGSLGDRDAESIFLSSIGLPLRASLMDERLLAGLRAESMFKSLVVELRNVRMIKQEDVGEAWSRDPDLRVPDFRVVLSDGAAILVEVKAFYQKENPARLYKASRRYLDGLRRYGELNDLPVHLAVYWARWNLWTLVPLASVVGERKGLSLADALVLNDLGRLGDFLIGTRPPLVLRLGADPSKERRVLPSGVARFTVGSADLLCNGTLLERKDERAIAFWFMLFGSWDCRSEAETEDGELMAVSHIVTAPKSAGQDFAFVGAVSSLLSRRYLDQTSEAGRVARLGVSASGGSIAKLLPKNFASSRLPIWRFEVEPGTV